MFRAILNHQSPCLLLNTLVLVGLLGCQSQESVRPTESVVPEGAIDRSDLVVVQPNSGTSGDIDIWVPRDVSGINLFSRQLEGAAFETPAETRGIAEVLEEGLDGLAACLRIDWILGVDEISRQRQLFLPVVAADRLIVSGISHRSGTWATPWYFG